MKSANKVKMRTSIIVLFFIIVAAFCKYAYRLSDVILFDKFAVFVRVFIYIGLFCAWAVSINKRILHSQVRKTLVTVAIIMIFWLTVREFKWRLVIDLTALRYLWYTYYIPIMLIPLIAFIHINVSRQTGRLPSAEVYSVFEFVYMYSYCIGADK